MALENAHSNPFLIATPDASADGCATSLNTCSAETRTAFKSDYPDSPKTSRVVTEAK